jgi:hypothetical protein
MPYGREVKSKGNTGSDPNETRSVPQTTSVTGVAVPGYVPCHRGLQMTMQENQAKGEKHMKIKKVVKVAKGLCKCKSSC